ncbi:MAG: hypothetical protein NC118_03640 [Eubacterium sp.]|nr:hypothetical protein [Eubacterium sp.]
MRRIKKIILNIFTILYMSMAGNFSAYAQEAEELPEVYYRILNSSMAIEGEGQKYTKDEIRGNEDIPLIFRTIICGDFEDIPWGRLPWKEEQEKYFEQYRKKGIWQFLLKDIDGDGIRELLLRNEEGQWLIIYEEQDGEPGFAGRFYMCTFGEKRYSIAEMIKDKQMFVFGDIYLNDGTHVDICKYKSNGHTDIKIQLQEIPTGIWLQDTFGSCIIIRAIDDYDEYRRHVENGEVADYLIDDMQNINHKGVYYFMDGEMITAQEAREWLEDNIGQKIIPAEEWGIVP